MWWRTAWGGCCVAAYVCHAPEAEAGNPVGDDRRAAEGGTQTARAAVPPPPPNHAVSRAAYAAGIRLRPHRIGLVRIEAPLPDVAGQIVDHAAGPDPVPAGMCADRRWAASVTPAVTARRNESAGREVGALAGGRLVSPRPRAAVAPG